MSSPVFLSILIPVYNWDIGPLLDRLCRQGQRLPDGVQVEILVLDDGSTTKTKHANASLAEQLPLVHYEESAVNRGRAATRNALLKQAQGEFVLFLDADMLPDREDFLRMYLEQGDQGAEIVCGGISYEQNNHNRPEYDFYLYKSRHTEALTAEIRNRSPWRYLFTSNIMVRRDIVESVRFDPRFTGYGFEDIEWGIRLSRSYTVLHIDNTCSHMGVMTKKEVMAKMRESIPNFSLLIGLHPAETGRAGAARPAFVLRCWPDVLLLSADRLLTALFFALRWNPLLFYLFQGHKALLLAREIKKTSRGGLA
ncbi:MAG TPA: glycosyltransferase family 2 protein [Desulfobulbus sp.]|nr:glycosyltransferase family 2 protein [Desulfobulbus sp.]